MCPSRMTIHTVGPLLRVDNQRFDESKFSYRCLYAQKFRALPNIGRGFSCRQQILEADQLNFIKTCEIHLLFDMIFRTLECVPREIEVMYLTIRTLILREIPRFGKDV